MGICVANARYSIGLYLLPSKLKMSFSDMVSHRQGIANRNEYPKVITSNNLASPGSTSPTRRGNPLSHYSTPRRERPTHRSMWPIMPETRSRSPVTWRPQSWNWRPALNQPLTTTNPAFNSNPRRLHSNLHIVCKSPTTQHMMPSRVSSANPRL